MELGNRLGDPSRNRELLASVKRRTSATSKQRALSRLLARYGSTTGSSGTTVNPRRFP